jgi:PAS domain S-box-containing protein
VYWLVMKSVTQLWKSISDFRIDTVPEQGRRSIVILNRINFFIILISLFGFIASVSDYWIMHGGRPEIGTLRLLLMMLSGLISFVFVAWQRYFVAKITASILPAFFLIIFPTILGDVKIEYYFYYPPAGIALAMIPVMLFPQKKERIWLISLVFFCFLLSVTSDNLLSYFSYDYKSLEILQGRYFFYKLSDILLFLFIILIVFSLKDINTRYETILSNQNIRLLAQKEELTAQSEELTFKNDELNKLNLDLGSSNLELEKLKIHLEDLVKSRTAALSESELRFRSIFENANDAIFMMKGDVFQECNLKTAEMFGYSKEQIIGSTPVRFSPDHQPDGSKSVEKADEKIKASLEGFPQRFEWLHARMDGGLFDAEVSLSRLNLGGENFLLAIVRDITERKKSEQALRDSEKKFRNIFDKTKHGIIILGPDLTIMAANKAVTDISGHLTEADVPLNVLDILLPEHIQLAKERFSALINGENLAPVEYKVKYKDGHTHVIEAESSIMDYYGQNAILVILRDVTHIKEAEQKVLDAIIQTEENERSRIAQDLHDGLGPVLSTIKIYFQVYEDTKDQDKREQLTKKLKNTIEEAIKGISEISHNISPHVLRNYGFYAALKQLIHQISLTNIVKFNLDLGNERELNENTGITLYRTISELINNSIKHANCSNISVIFSNSEGFLQVDYSDDGKGFIVNSVIEKPVRGSGLQNIMNRINALNGKVEFSSTLERGMQAFLKIPI